MLERLKKAIESIARLRGRSRGGGRNGQGVASLYCLRISEYSTASPLHPSTISPEKVEVPDEAMMRQPLGVGKERPLA